MSKEVTKAVKGSTSAVRATADALDRARAIYLAGLKRLESEYFERVREATRDLSAEPQEEATNGQDAVNTEPEAVQQTA